MESDHSRVLSELGSIEQAIEALTPLHSRWSGLLRLETVQGERGSKSFECDITLRPDMVVSPIRWRTLIHEMFHACSTGFQIHDFNACRGWEEGVVEQLSRLYRKPILEHIGVHIDLTQLASLDSSHPFNGYIAVLEAIRAAVNIEEPRFYLDLLMTPIRNRYASLLQLALQLDAVQSRHAIAVLSASRPTLEGRAP